jgi:hypothetical protein
MTWEFHAWAVCAGTCVLLLGLRTLCAAYKRDADRLLERVNDVFDGNVQWGFNALDVPDIGTCFSHSVR